MMGAHISTEDLSCELRHCWTEVLAVAMLAPTSYLLVLFAMRLAPVSHIAIGSYFGSRFLNGGHTARRLAGSSLIVAGVIAVTLN